MKVAYSRLPGLSLTLLHSVKVFQKNQMMMMMFIGLTLMLLHNSDSYTSVHALHIMFVGDSQLRQQYASFAETIRYGLLPEEKAFPFHEMYDYARLNIRNLLHKPKRQTNKLNTENLKGINQTDSESQTEQAPNFIVKNLKLTPRSLLMNNCSTKSAQVGNRALCSPEVEPVNNCSTAAGTVNATLPDPSETPNINSSNITHSLSSESQDGSEVDEFVFVGREVKRAELKQQTQKKRLEKLEKSSVKWAERLGLNYTVLRSLKQRM